MPHDIPSELAALFGAREGAARDHAWARFVECHSRLLLHVARSFGGGHDAVMDRYAFILERLRGDDYRRLESWASDRRSKLTTWLVIVAQRLSLDQNRQRYGRPRNLTEQPDPTRATRRRLADLLGVALDVDAGPSSDADDPDVALRRAELASALAQSVAELPPADQLLLTLRFQDELAATEIARILGYPSPFHVYRHINRLLDQLRRALRRRGVDDPNP